jgi:SOS-response transcriptional repressor LexA
VNAVPAAVVPIRALKHGAWSLLEVAPAGQNSKPCGILLAGERPEEYAQRLKPWSDFAGSLSEQEADVLEALEQDLAAKAREGGGQALLTWLQDSLSHFLRISDSTAIAYSDNEQAVADRLFDEYVDGRVQRFVTHLPLYSLRAAATKFGEATETEGAAEDWVRVPAGLRLSEDMFVARVVGRSMEPLIPDGSLCVFRAIGAGTRQGKRVLVEKIGETDFAARYTVKRYTSAKHAGEEGEAGEWRHARIRLEPLNREFEAFDLSGDEFESNFRVIGEFVEVLDR